MVVNLTIDCFRRFRLTEIIAELSMTFSESTPMFFGLFGIFFI